MTQLRTVDPRVLIANPNNPRQVSASPGMDEQLRASIRAIGIIQPPIIRESGEQLIISAGHRRIAAAIDIGLEAIEVLVTDHDEVNSAMASLSENLIRASMNSVDIWRAIERLEAQGWNEQAIADALALPLRTVRRLKLLAHVHPPMLEAMARGDMPGDEQLRTIAAASPEDQAQVWKKLKPRKNEPASWYEISRALKRRRIPATMARFDDDLAAKYGIVWDEDLFAPGDEDSRYTTDVEAFFGAQQEWLENHLPKNAVILPIDDNGHPSLPKGAQKLYGKPAKGDITGYYVDPHTAQVVTIAYRPAETKTPAKAKNKQDASNAAESEPETEETAKQRPDVTQKGEAMIGDFQTDALHEALSQQNLADLQLMAYLVMALAGKNVDIRTGQGTRYSARHAIVRPLVNQTALTMDADVIRQSARAMLAHTLSCRVQFSNSGIVAQIVGHDSGADRHLPNMATEEFLSCLSRQALERVAKTTGALLGPRVKDTRAAIIKHLEGQTWRYPQACFAPDQEAIDDAFDTHSWERDDEDGSAENPEEPTDDGEEVYSDAAA